MPEIEVKIPCTGELKTISCDDPDQLMTAIDGTAKQIDKAILNKGKSRSEQFVMVNQNRLQTILDDPQFKGADALVLLKLQNKVGYGNRIKITQKQIAEELKLGKATVSRAFKKLKAARVIYKDKSVTTHVAYRLSTDYGIKGKRELNGTKDMVEKIHHTKTGIRLKSIAGGKAK